MASALVQTWRLFEADPRIAGLVVGLFAALAVAYLVVRGARSRKGRR